MSFIDYSAVFRVANVVRSLLFSVNYFDDTRFFPPKNADKEWVARFFFFIVAIDHRTGFGDRRFEGYVDGEFFFGSDLLYRLAARKFHNEPSFFSPENMAEIDEDVVKEWLSPDEPSGVHVPDPDIRAYLLRDAGKKLLDLYDGKVLEIAEKSKYRLRTMEGDGFVERLKIFRAYEDPVEKKAFLLVKFLVRRGIVSFVDLENFELPIDNHLVRIAVRLGLLKNFELGNLSVSYEEDIAVRILVRRAYKILSKESGVASDLLDDFLWVHGRTCCLFGEPKCDDCKNPVVRTEGCPLRSVCTSYSKKDFPNEHIYLKTWYY